MENESDGEFGFEEKNVVAYQKSKSGNKKIKKMIDEDRETKKKTTSAQAKVKRLLKRKRRRGIDLPTGKEFNQTGSLHTVLNFTQ